ncbi:MAG: TIGR02266 family protein [Polyangiaceae bacterium]
MQPSRDKNVSAQAESGTHSSEASRPSGAVGSADARRHPRHDVELEVTMESESNFYMGLTENLSEGGIFIATHVLKPLGSVISVSFKLPEVEEPIKATGSVRWIREYSETSDASPGLGVRFEQLTTEQYQQIHRFLAARDPLFYDED